MMHLLTVMRLVQKSLGQDWKDARMRCRVWAAKGLGDPCWLGQVLECSVFRRLKSYLDDILEGTVKWYTRLWMLVWTRSFVLEGSPGDVAANFTPRNLHPKEFAKRQPQFVQRSNYPHGYHSLTNQ